MPRNNPPADQAARDYVVSDRTHNLWVEAGAGTGKTTLLVGRILSLLLDDKRPLRLARIAAITFTEKAAGELKVKIRERIERQLRDGADEARRDTLAQALADLETAAISTLHSFAGALIRERPVEAGIDPRAATLDAAASDRLLARVYDAWFDELVADPEPPSILRWYLGETNYYERRGDHDRLWKLVRKIANDADVLLDAPLPESRETLLDAAVAALVVVAREALTHARRCCHKTDDKALVQLEDFVPAVKALPSAQDWDAARAAIDDLPPINRVGGKKGDWDDGELGKNKNQRGELAERCKAPRRGDCDPQAREMFELARECVRRFQDEKQRRGGLGFQDLLDCAATMLRENKIARGYFQKRFDAVLIDEFQDTDPLQVEIAFFLCEDGAHARTAADVRLAPGKLMVVGDPKQSIYRFRRADIEVYENTKRAVLGEADPTLITVNFRCAPGIIGWVNRVFEPLMKHDADLPISPQYVALDVGRAEVPPDAGVVLLRPDDTGSFEKADDARLAEMAAVARHIARAHADGLLVHDKDRGRMRPLQWRDVAILSRRKAEFAGLEAALRRENVPYRVEGGKVFFQRPEVTAVVNALAALEDPDDSLALAGFLAGDLVGVSDEALLLHRLTRADGRLSYLGKVETAQGDLGPLLLALAALHENRNRVGCLATVRGLLDRFGLLPTAAALARGEVAVANLHKVLDAARAADSGALSFGEFAREWSQALAEGRDEGDFAVTEDADDVVRVMTIHKAKGLDWPMVVLLDLGAKSEAPGGPEPVLFRRLLPKEKRLGIALAADQTTFNYADLAAEEKAFEEAERVRQLYVATTRARDHLVVPLFGKVAWKIDKKTGEVIEPNKQRGYFKFLVESGVIDNALQPTDEAGARVQEVAVAELPTDVMRWRLPREIAAYQPSPDEQTAIDACLAARDTAPPLPSTAPMFASPSALGAPPTATGGYGRKLGDAFHQLVERVDLTAPESDDAEAADNVAAPRSMDGSPFSMVAKPLKMKGDENHAFRRPRAEKARDGFVSNLDAALAQIKTEFDLRPAEVKTLRRWLDNLLAMPCFAAARAGQVWREAPFTFTDAHGRDYRGQVDLLARTDEDVLVLDFKTDRVDDDNLAAHLAHYRPQGEVYRDAARALTGAANVRFFFCFVDAGLACEV